MSEQVKLGLTFYGGVSLAVFEAGIAYELVRAAQFSRWQDKPKGVPEIHVDVVTGTSAGGLAAVQLAAALGGTNTEAVLAKMVSIWANDADIQALLPASDFDKQGFLDNQRLRDRVHDVLEMATIDTGPRLEDDLDVSLTLTNFSGLREPVILVEDGFGHAFPTTRHVEYERFCADDVTDPAQRQRFVDAAAVTAGFPIAFPPALKTSSAIAEDKPESEATRFVYVDGGLMDNRPLGVALDSIAEKPAPRRLFFFIDPSETWVPPSYGAADPDDRRLDPVGISLSLGAVARSDSIFHDLERIRGTKDLLAVLTPLSRQLFEDSQLRRALLRLHPEVVQRNFNRDAWALWLLVERAVGSEVRAQWERVREQGRFALRARLHEFVDRLQEAGDLDAPAAAEIKVHVDNAAGWRGYYDALRGLRALNRRFQQLKFEVWHRHFKHLPRCRPGQDTPPLSADLQDKLGDALEDLAAAAERLRAERDRLAEELLTGEVLQRLKMTAEDKRAIQDLFYDYAGSMQVLEALSGTRLSPNLSVRRITPFDIYAHEADLGQAKPLAGGALGAFGGFLDKGWRINDFLVGRLAMRAHLRNADLVPEAAFADYRRWSNERDAGVVALLTPGSEEAGALSQFAALEPSADGYSGDQEKPALLLKDSAMEVDMLPGSRIARVVRKLFASTRRILRQNRSRLPYSALSVLSLPLRVAGGLVWVLEQSLRPVPGRQGDTTSALADRLKWYLAVLAIGVVIGLLIGAWIG
jgi:predicted acylesterase/phospholipase RssA